MDATSGETCGRRRNERGGGGGGEGGRERGRKEGGGWGERREGEEERRKKGREKQGFICSELSFSALHMEVAKQLTLHISACGTHCSCSYMYVLYTHTGLHLGGGGIFPSPSSFRTCEHCMRCESKTSDAPQAF